MVACTRCGSTEICNCWGPKQHKPPECNTPSGHPGFMAILDDMRALHIKKAADYGLGGDFLANCRGSEQFGVPAWVGTMIRAMDKVVRIKAYIANGKLENESVDDSLMDLANYSIIALLLLREERAKQKFHNGPIDEKVDEVDKRTAELNQRLIDEVNRNKLIAKRVEYGLKLNDPVKLIDPLPGQAESRIYYVSGWNGDKVVLRERFYVVQGDPHFEVYPSNLRKADKESPLC